MKVIKPNWVIEHKFEFEALTEKEYEQMIKYRPVHDFFPERGHKIIDTLEEVPDIGIMICRQYIRKSRERDCGSKGCPLEQDKINVIRINCNFCGIKHKRKKRSRNHKHRH